MVLQSFQQLLFYEPEYPSSSWINLGGIEDEFYNKITGFDYIIGSGNGYIRNFTGLTGHYDLGELKSKGKDF